MKRKWMCVVLLGVILLGTLSAAGCGKSGTEDSGGEYTLVWALPFAEQKDAPRVLQKANEMLKELLPNTKLSMKLDGQMASKWSLWMAGNTTIDVAHVGFVTDLQTDIDAENLIPLNDLIDKYAPTIKDQRNNMFQDLYRSGEYKGELYAVPIPQIYVKEALSVTLPAELAQYMDIPALVNEGYASSTTTEKMYQIIDKYLSDAKAAGAIGTESVASILNPENVYYMAQRGYEFIGGAASSVCYRQVPEGGKVEFVDFHQTQEFKEYIKWMSKWFADGFVSQDVLTGGGAGSKTYLVECHYVDRIGEEANHTRTKFSPSANMELTNIFITNPEYDYRGSSKLGELNTFVGIPATSKNPARAMQFIELLYSEKGADLLNLLNFGFEGESEHYTKRSDKEIQAKYAGQGTSSDNYGIPPWMTANMFNSYIINPYTVETYDYAVNYFKNTRPAMPKTPLYGCSMDSSPVTRELSQMGLVNEEYEKQLIFGVYKEYTPTYENMNNKMGEAGIAKIITEYQKQADEYTKSK